MKNKVSVIMGIYNCQETLAQSLDSLLAQTYTEWNVIMCDDGSTDSTYSVAQMYADRHPDKFILIKNEINIGLNATLNKCLKVADGEYVARMDGDDISLPERFQKQVEFLDSHPEYSFVSSFMDTFDEEGIWGIIKRPEIPTLSDMIHRPPCFNHAPVMIRREAYNAVGGYTEDKRLLRYEDCNLWHKLYGRKFYGYNLQESLYRMRDDHNAYKRRTFSSRMRAVYVVAVGIREMKLPKYYYLLLIPEFFKNLIKAILPESVYRYIHRKKLRVNNTD